VGATSKRLNAWQRFFLVLTVLWLVLGTYCFWYAQVNENYNRAEVEDRLCEKAGDALNMERYAKNLDACQKEFESSMDRYGGERWGLLGGFFLLNMLATAFFWTVIWVGLLIVRWILAGRNVPDRN